MATGSKITAIQIQNFKSIGKTPQTLQIRPLTILAGANSSGKSTLMQPLLLLKQTIESEFDPGPLWLDGPHLRLSQVDQLISLVPGADKRGFQFSFRMNGGGWLGFRFSNSPKTGLQLEANTWQPKQHSRLETILPSTPRRRSGPFVVRTDDLFIRAAARAMPKDDALRGMIELRRSVGSALHVRGVRAPHLRTQPKLQVSGRWTGPFDAYAASVIYGWQNEKDSGALTSLQDWLMSLGLTQRVEAKKIDDVTLELLVARLAIPSKRTMARMIPIADVGFGVSQVLPALVALLAAPRDGLVYIEQPELHLHPNPQVKLAHIFAQMANSGGASIVVETHSSLLIREIQTLVAEGTLDPSKVSLNWCNRDPKTGATTVTQAGLGKDGSYGDWPIDFDNVAMDSERRFWNATSVPKRR